MRLRALIDAMPIANGLLKPANIPISNRRIGDRGCKGKCPCDETPAGGHFPRAQEWGNAPEENKVAPAVQSQPSPQNVVQIEDGGTIRRFPKK